jgi:DNA-binding transcriptional ArsR family regulator
MRPASQALDELFGPACARLLDALVSAPAAGAHVRELGRAAGLSLSSLQRELSRLTTLGIVQPSRRGNRLLYALRRAEPLVALLTGVVTMLKCRGRRFDAMPVDRGAEDAFVRSCAHLPPDPALWRSLGDAEFLAGVAVLLAGHGGFDRASYLGLAESLAPGAGRFERHEAWHARHRPRLARFLSKVDRERQRHARASR